MALSGYEPGRFLIGEHPDEILIGMGMIAPGSVEDMKSQLTIIEETVKRYFEQECPQLRFKNGDNEEQKSNVWRYNRAAELVIEYGSWVEFQKFQTDSIAHVTDDNERFAISLAADYFKQSGGMAENILRMRQAIERETQAQSQVIDSSSVVDVSGMMQLIGSEPGDNFDSKLNAMGFPSEYGKDKMMLLESNLVALQFDIGRFTIAQWDSLKDKLEELELNFLSATSEIQKIAEEMQSRGYSTESSFEDIERILSEIEK